MEQSTIKVITVPAIIYIPENAVEITITAKLFAEDKVQTAHITMHMDELRKAIREAEECYFPDDATFTLTDKGRAVLKEM